MATPFQITVDCDDAKAMSEFWAHALGYVVEPPPAGYLSWDDFLRANAITIPPPGSLGAIVDPDDTGPRILFLRADYTGTARRRVHLDVRAGDDADKLAKIAELVSAGATEVRRIDEHGDWWMVMTDPEGNEFCVT